MLGGDESSLLFPLFSIGYGNEHSRLPFHAVSQFGEHKIDARTSKRMRHNFYTDSPPSLHPFWSELFTQEKTFGKFYERNGLKYKNEVYSFWTVCSD